MPSRIYESRNEKVRFLRWDVNRNISEEKKRERRFGSALMLDNYVKNDVRIIKKQKNS